MEKIAVPRDVYSELHGIFTDISKSHSIYVSKPPLKSNLIFHDEIWGQVEIPWPASALFVIPMFTRSSGIRQLGATVFQYTGVTHTRLAHQIGVAHLMRKAYQNIINKAGDGLKNLSKNLLEDSVQEFWKPYLERCSKNMNTKVAELVKNFVNSNVFDGIYDLVFKKLGEVIIIVAGLVHDLGHGGWSHALDGINEVLRRNIEKTGLTKRLAAPRIHDIRKLDILVGIYLLNTSPQFDVLWDALSEYVYGNHSSMTSYEEVKRLFNSMGRSLLPYVITAIISEDRGYLAPLYRHYFSTLLAYYIKMHYGPNQHNVTGNEGQDLCTNILSVIAVIELLAVVIEIGIFLLDDINADRLDWVPRDALNLGHQQKHNLFGGHQQGGDLHKKIENAIDSWVPACVDVEYDKSVKLIKVRLKTKGGNINVSSSECNELINLRKDIVKTRKELYTYYHSTFKALVDSIVLRMAYSVAIIAEQAVEAGLNLMTANDALFSLISSQDDVFLHYASAVLSGVGRKLLALLEIPQMSTEILSNVRYASRTSKPHFMFLTNLFYPVTAATTPSRNNSELYRIKVDGRELIVMQIRLGEVIGDFPRQRNQAEEDKNKSNLYTTILLESPPNALDSLMQSIIDNLELPSIEQEINKMFGEKGYGVDIYLTGIHYGVKELGEIVRDILRVQNIREESQGSAETRESSALNNNIQRVLNLPLVFLFIYNFGSQPSGGESLGSRGKYEEIRGEIIKKLQETNSIRVIREFLATYVVK